MSDKVINVDSYATNRVDEILQMEKEKRKIFDLMHRKSKLNLNVVKNGNDKRMKLSLISQQKLKRKVGRMRKIASDYGRLYSFGGVRRRTNSFVRRKTFRLSKMQLSSATTTIVAVGSSNHAMDIDNESIQHVPKSRKGRRKLKYLRKSKSEIKEREMDIANDSDDEVLNPRRRIFRWLPETHVWHAKRMEMKKMWGYCLADTSRLKSESYLLKHALYGSVMHDASYTRCIKIHAENISILQSVFNNLFDNIQVNNLMKSEKFMNGQMVCEMVCYQNKTYPYQPIGPVRIQISKIEGNDFIIWCHPLILEPVKSAINLAIDASKVKAIAVSDMHDKYLVFELTGPSSLVNLQTAIHKCGWRIPRNQKGLLSHSVKEMEEGDILHFTLEHESDMIENKTKVKKHSFVCPLTSTVITISNMVQHYKSDLFRKGIPLNQYSFGQTIENDDEKTKNKRKRRRHSSKVDNDSVKNINAVNLTIVRRIKDININSWEVIIESLSSLKGKKLYVELSYAGCHAIGISLKHKLITLSKRLCFPFDYPDCPSSIETWNEIESQLTNNLDKIPKSKRGINYKKLGIISPFKPNWSLLSESDDYTTMVVRGWHNLSKLHLDNSMDIKKQGMTAVTLVCSRTYGKLSSCSLIYVASQSDITTLFPMNGSTKKKRKYFKGMLKYNEDESKNRQIIGIITSGSNYFLWQSIGIGFVSIKGYSQLRSTAIQEQRKTHTRRLLVLVREPHRNYYFPAYLSIAT